VAAPVKRAAVRHTPVASWALLVCVADTALEAEMLPFGHAIRLAIYLVLYRTGEVTRDVLTRRLDPHGYGGEVVPRE
jgi:hypothetical protein